jgi:hypothetical protein
MNQANQDARSKSAKGDITVSREFSVAVPKDEGVLVLRSDWNRIKTMVARIVPVKNWYQVSGSVSVGIAVAAAFSLIGFASSKDVPTWARFTDSCALVCGIVLAVALFALDAQQHLYTTHKTTDVTEEMDRIERLCDAVPQGGDMNGIAILSARYGASGAWADVGPLLGAKVQNGKLRIMVTNEDLGGDPAPNITKSLEVNYSRDGTACSKVVPEGQELSLPEGG